MNSAPTTLDDVFELYEFHGDRKYGEDVTGLDHALQCAALATTDGATSELVVAALFHDVGWLLSDDEFSENVTPVNDEHAALGSRILAPLLGPSVAQPVALHVMAKRWRCTIDPDYFDELSEASQITFIAQGGPLGTDERARFEAHPGFVMAMALRSWDDRAKIPHLSVAPLTTYRTLAHDVADDYARSRENLAAASARAQ
ncbi:MAG TPA: HD domain-containing protein [Acidimicrobiales bacterium]